MDIPKTDVGDRIAGGQDPARKERQGLPEATPRGNRMNPLTWPSSNGGKPAKLMEKQLTLRIGGARNRLSIPGARLS
jgi:hypothetical protein